MAPRQDAASAPALQDRLSSASQAAAPSAGAAVAADFGASAARISLSVLRFGREAHDELSAQEDRRHAHAVRPLRLRDLLQASERRRLLADVAYRDPSVPAVPWPSVARNVSAAAQCGQPSRTNASTIDGLRRGLGCIRRRTERFVAVRHARQREHRGRDQQHRSATEEPPAIRVQRRTPANCPAHPGPEGNDPCELIAAHRRHSRSTLGLMKINIARRPHVPARTGLIFVRPWPS